VGPIPPPVCPVCSKPVRSGTLVLYEEGDLFHVTCRTRALGMKAMEQVDRAKAAQSRATRNLEDVERRRRQLTAGPRLRGTLGLCPVCGQSATVTDWRPSVDWVAIEGCSCRGFFIWAGIYGSRVASLTEADRLDLSARIRTCRVMGHEAWCTTIDGTVNGAILVRTERPARVP
jgi:hypothetical protein